MRKKILVKVEPYVKHWLESSFGNPVNLPQASPERKLIELYIRPGDDDEQVDDPDNYVEILVPNCRNIDCKRMGKISLEMKDIISDSLSSVFTQKIWEEYNILRKVKTTQKKIIYGILEEYGIPDNYWDTINKKLYRIRCRYDKKQNV